MQSVAGISLVGAESSHTDFNDFIGKCLTKNPDDRPSADELLKHPFVNKSFNPEKVLGDLIEESAHVIATYGREGNPENESVACCVFF